MDHVIEIKNFYEKFVGFTAGKGQSISKLRIWRYFECLEIRFSYHAPAQASPCSPMAGVGDILPRVEASRLTFRCNANVEGEGNEAVEKALSECFAEFFTRECNQGDTTEFLKRLAEQKASETASEAIKALFFVEPQTSALFLRVAG